MAIEITTFETNPEWNSMTIKQKWSTWNVSSHQDGDVEIECEIDNWGREHLFLNQEELKKFIKFLQTKIK
jgi:hypothetical protein